MKKIFLSLLVFVFVLLSACQEREVKVSSTSMPDAEEVLMLDPEADIFQWNDVVYKTGVDWVEELQLSKNKELGEITSVSPDPKNYNYKNGMANKLPFGAKIYSAKERGDIFIVEYEGNVKKYLGIGEG